MEEQTAVQAPSLGKVLGDIFIAPSDLFENFGNTAPRHSLWLVPLIVSILIGILTIIITYSNDTLRYQMLEIQRQAIEKQVEKQQLTQEQAEKILEGMESANVGLFIGFGAIGVTIMTFLYYLAAALILWGINKLILKTNAGYIHHLELYGTATWIGILGSIVSLLLMVGLGSLFAQPAASIVIYESFDVTSTLHRVLAAINIFSIWQTAVIGIGLSKLSGKPLSHGITLAFVLWLLWIPISIVLNVAR